MQNIEIADHEICCLWRRVYSSSHKGIGVNVRENITTIRKEDK